jgi:hypothetical protein
MPSKGNDFGDGGQFVADDDGVGGFHGNVGSGAAHGHSGVCGGQGGGVVDAVADQEDPLAGVGEMRYSFGGAYDG